MQTSADAWGTSYKKYIKDQHIDNEDKNLERAREGIIHL